MKNSLCLLALLFLTSCASWDISGTRVSKKIAKLELGMSKKEVLSIVNEDYKPLSATITPDGNLESILFYEYSPNYVVTFLDGKLVEYYMKMTHEECHHHQDEPKE